MPIDVGKINEIQFTVLVKTDEALGRNMVAKLNEYAARCPAAREFMASVAAVKVVVKKYGGSGAVAIHKIKQINVSNALKGGAHEGADATLFELYNWHQGDYSSREQKQVTDGLISPERAGTNIACGESRTIHSHGLLMDALAKAGVGLSAFGEAARAATAGKSGEETQRITLASAHDANAPADDMMSLVTPEMYFYQTINGIGDAAITLRAFDGPPEWLKSFVNRAWQISESQPALPPGEVYTKLLTVAKGCGIAPKGSFEFSAAMNMVAGLSKLPSKTKIMGMRSLVETPGAPANLEAAMKAAFLIP